MDDKVVRRGMYWRGVKGADDYKQSPLDLSNTPDRATIEKWMGENRNRGLQVFSVTTGAGSKEQIAKIERPTHWLQVSLKSGHNLLSADDNGYSDPYCDLFVLCPSRSTCKHMWRSSTKMSTLDPKWDEDQRVPLLTDGALLHLTCFDWDRVGNDDFLGECLVDLRQYADGRLHRLTLTLDQYETAMKTNDANEEVRGKVVIEVKITPRN